MLSSEGASLSTYLQGLHQTKEFKIVDRADNQSCSYTIICVYLLHFKSFVWDKNEIMNSGRLSEETIKRNMVWVEKINSTSEDAVVTSS